MSGEDDRNESSFTRRLVGRIPDVMGRALVAGTGALFLTEEGIRNLVSDLKLPGEAVRVLQQQAETTKKELFRLVGREIRSFMEQSNISQELLKVLGAVTVDVHTTIRFVPNEEGGVTPEFAHEVSTSGPEPEAERPIEGGSAEGDGGSEAAAGEGGGDPAAATEPARGAEPRGQVAKGQATDQADREEDAEAE